MVKKRQKTENVYYNKQERKLVYHWTNLPTMSHVVLFNKTWPVANQSPTRLQ